MDLSDFLSELLIVVVFYKTKPREAVALSSLNAALRDSTTAPHIFIYDNSPDPSPLVQENATYVHDPENGGVSRAYNRASDHAARMNKKWMLLLDQDTSVSITLFSQMIEALSRHPLSPAFVPRIIDKKGLLSPFRFKYGRGKRITSIGEIAPLRAYRFINSGLFVRQSAFSDAGGYDNRIPLDFSDISFGNRLEKLTDHVVVVDVSLYHSFSDNERLHVEDALARFRHYCAAALLMARTSGSAFLRFNVLVRGFRLAIRYRDHRFLAASIHHTLYG